MKYFILSCFILCSVLNSHAQLTRSETIKYIHDKINDTEFLKRTYDSQFTYTLTDLSFKTSSSQPNKIVLSYKRNFSDNTIDYQEFTLLPQYISSFEKSTEKAGDAVGLMKVIFTGPNVASYFKSTNSTIYYTSKNHIFIPYLQGDPIHYERLMKALQHLKTISLEILGNDPFVN
ncbi:hypothetical protein [Pedobacter flavus]|uniref:GLPGLI family protein n=1 Tax=Pedobacter flavus TaxID=3113906 RepID=A0ABU7H326_9SPHI|nr:hypothetical protein [Pedobacter sp. VNH31]MEE1885618.1 hypothetical protein [Pedobacter sp. VNH31]